MKKIPVIGIIGGGMMAQVCHIPFYRNASSCHLKAVAESRPSLVKHLKENCGVETVVSSLHEILNDPEIEAVVLIAPRASVGPLTMECLQAGKHVLTEKPMAHTAGQAHRLANEAAKQKLIYRIGYMKRHDPGVLAAKAFLDELRTTGRFGALLSARFYDHAKSNVLPPPAHQRPLESRAERYEEWPLAPEWLAEDKRANYAWFMNVLSHDVNLLHFFFGEGVNVISTASPADGVLHATLRHGNVPIVLEGSRTEAGVWLQGAEFFFESGAVRIEIPSPMDVGKASKVEIFEKDKPLNPTLLPTEQGWSFALQAESFIRALQGQNTDGTSGEEAAQELELIENIWKKA